MLTEATCAWCGEQFWDEDEVEEIDHRLFHAGKVEKHPEVRNCAQAWREYCRALMQAALAEQRKYAS